MMSQMFSIGERSGLQADQFSTRTLLLRSYAVVLAAVCGLDSSNQRTPFPFETVHFKWALAHRTRRRFWTMFTYGFLFCMIELYLASANGMVTCVYQRWFLEVFLSPFSNVNDRIMPMSDVVSSEGLQTMGIQQRSSYCPLHTEISPVSLNILMIRFAKPLQFDIDERCF